MGFIEKLVLFVRNSFVTVLALLALFLGGYGLFNPNAEGAMSWWLSLLIVLAGLLLLFRKRLLLWAYKKNEERESASEDA